VPLRSATALWALARHYPDPADVVALAGTYATWDEMTAVSPVERARRLAITPIRLPAGCPPPPLPDGCALLGRFDAGYPPWPETLTDAPPAVTCFGTPPQHRLVAIGGGDHPTTAGLTFARQAVTQTAAADQAGRRLGIVAVLGSPIGDAALTAAIAAGLPPVAIATAGAAVLAATHPRWIAEVTAAGGAVLSACPPHAHMSDATRQQAARLVGTAGRVVVLAETGVTAAAGVELAAAALRARRFVIVAGHDTARQVALSDIGSLALARIDGTGLFGDIPAVADRLAAGRPPADAVVADGRQLQTAISYGCGLSTVSPASPDVDGWLPLT